MENLNMINSMLEAILETITGITGTLIMILAITSIAVCVIALIILPIYMLLSLAYMNLDEYLKEKTNKTIKQHTIKLIGRIKERINNE